jgi:hypothetical protein
LSNLSAFRYAANANKIAKRQIQWAHNQDGLPELTMGLFFLIVSSLCYAQGSLPEGSVPFKAAAVASAVVVPLLCYAIRPAVQWLRTRYLLDRVGYFEPKRTSGSERRAGAAVALIVLVVLLLLSQLPPPGAWLLVFTGLASGALAAGCGHQPRFIVSGSIVAVSGVVIAMSEVSLSIGFAILFGLTGVLSLVSGAVVLSRLLRHRTT